MINVIKTSVPYGLNKGHGLKFCIGFQVWQTPEEGWKTFWVKHWEYNNKDEDNSSKTLNNNTHQVSSKQFRNVSWDNQNEQIYKKLLGWISFHCFFHENFFNTYYLFNILLIPVNHSSNLKNFCISMTFLYLLNSKSKILFTSLH